MQEEIQATIDKLVASGAERGVQVAVYRDGEQVVDAVAGVADPASGRPVTSDTPFYSYSVGKGVTAAVVHVLVERGAFGYDTRIAELWPEFGAHGKQAVTVRQVLDHSAGVPGMPLDTTPTPSATSSGGSFAAPPASRSRRCRGRRLPGRWAWPRSCTSACRRPSTTAGPVGGRRGRRAGGGGNDGGRADAGRPAHAGHGGGWNPRARMPASTSAMVVSTTLTRA